MDIFDHDITVPTLAEPIYLVPLGCIHADTEGFKRPLFEQAINFVRDNPNAYTIGLGDYFDLARTAYRRHLQSYQGDKDSRKSIDRYVKERSEQFCSTWLKRLKPRLLGLAEGNHHYEFQDGTTDTQLMCRELGVPYLGVASWHRIRFSRKTEKSLRVLTMFVHHGNWGSGGGGRTKGASRNAADTRATGRWADIILFAHDHKPDAWIDTWQMVPVRGIRKIAYTDRLFARAGTFMQGDVEGCTTYVERALMRPEKPGFTILKVRFSQSYSPERYRAAFVAKRNAREARGNANSNVEVTYQYEVVHG